MYDLTYWFDYTTGMVLHHPIISIATVLVGFLFYQALSTLKFIGTIISFGVAAVTALLLDWLMF